MSTFILLKILAKNTVGGLDAKIQEIEGQVIECIKGINPPMLSIPGIGALSAAIILSEKYENPSKMLSFAGLEPEYFQSRHTGRMVKHGSSHLCYALMNYCLPLDYQRACLCRVLASRRQAPPCRYDPCHKETAAGYLRSIRRALLTTLN
jgi:hypothetical protein